LPPVDWRPLRQNLICPRGLFPKLRATLPNPRLDIHDLFRVNRRLAKS